MIESLTASSDSTARVWSRSRRDAGLMLMDVLISMMILCLIMVIAMASFSQYRRKQVEAAPTTDSTVVTAGEVGFTFPWATFVAVLGIAIVVTWLFVMAQINKAKAEASAAAWLRGDEDTDTVENSAPAERTADNPFALTTTADGTPLTPAQVSGDRDNTRGKRRSSRGGGFLDKVGEFVDLLS